jgi:hypothetical protein
MKHDPGMHIGLHLVFFGKTGVIARGIEFNRTRIVSCKLMNGKKLMDHLRRNEDIGKTKGNGGRRLKRYGCGW